LIGSDDGERSDALSITLRSERGMDGLRAPRDG